MAQLKLSPPEKVLSPRAALSLKRGANSHAPAQADSPSLNGAERVPLATVQRLVRSKPESADRLRSAEELAAAQIAQRFAPRAQSAAAGRDQQSADLAPPAPPSIALPSGMRMLVAIIILATLVPNLTLGAMLWLGMIATPWSRSMTPSPHESPAPRDQSAIASVVLTAPARLQATAGEDVVLPIALDGTDGLPARSIVAISGLPQGSSLSSGRPYGKTEWTLKSDEIGDLHLVLPAAAWGESKLTIKLIAPDDKVIADAETVLDVAASTKGSLERAAQADSGDAGLALGAILEPNLIGIGLQGMEPKPVLAQAWYEGPLAPKAKGVEARLADLEAPQGMPADPVQSQPAGPAQTAHGEDRADSIEPLAFVNLRQGPSSSSPVIGVVAKGAKLLALRRKRGWVEVTDPATSKKGWIYGANLAGAGKARLVAKRAVRSEAPSGSDSFWSGLGQWLSSP
jgi:hypothetical protein